MTVSRLFVSALLELDLDWPIKIRVLSEQDFDFFVEFDADHAFYAFRYEKEGLGLGVHDIGLRVSHFWSLEDILDDGVEPTPAVLASLVERILTGERSFSKSRQGPVLVLGKLNTGKEKAKFSLFEL